MIRVRSVHIKACVIFINILQTDRADRESDGKTGRQTLGQQDRTDRWQDSQTDGKTEDRWQDRHTDSKTDTIWLPLLKLS